ncbi:MAG: hypothetical protein JKX72_12555 [Robiginitomaculum sp.]|nr:hypothetical protein [Robiginitomaculum sp.]
MVDVKIPELDPKVGVVAENELFEGTDPLNISEDPLGKSLKYKRSQIARSAAEVAAMAAVVANTAKVTANTANVDAAGAVMEADTSTAPMAFVIDEDNMVSDSPTKVPTQQSVKAYTDAEIAAAIVSSVTFKGSYDAATNTPDLDTAPTGVLTGDMYAVTVAGNFFTVGVEVGDVLIAEADSATLESQWTILNKNLDAASIKASYESNADTNAFTDSEQSEVAANTAKLTANTANVDAAGAVMETDASTAPMAFVIDEDNMASDSPTKVPTQQSVKAYTDAEIAAAIVSSVTFKGSYDAATNTPDLDTAPSGVLAGDMYAVTVAGNFFTIAVEIGDVLIAEIDSATLEADWTVVNKNLDAASIKTSYESNADTNAFTDSEQSAVAANTAAASKVKVSSNDTTPGDLEAKIVGGDGIIRSTLNEGGNESLQLQLGPHFIALASTGLYSGCLLSIGGPTGTFSMAVGKSLFVDSTTDFDDIEVIGVTIPSVTNVAITNILTQPVTYILSDSVGAITQQSNVPTPAERRDKTFHGVIVHSDNVNVNAVNNLPSVALDVSAQVQDIMAALGTVNLKGNKITANGSNLSLDKSVGEIFKAGVNFHVDKKNPHTKTIPVDVAFTFRYRNQDSSEGSDITLIDPGSYDNAGTTTSIGGSNNQATLQRIYMFPSGFIRVQYGQEIFSNLADAIDAAGKEAFVVEENIDENGLLLATLAIKKGASDISDLSDAQLFLASRFGDLGSVGSAAVGTLQDGYDNSIEPEIVTNSTLGALTIKRGSAADSDNVVEIQNGAGTVVAALTAEGNLILSGLVDGRDVAADGTFLDNLDALDIDETANRLWLSNTQDLKLSLLSGTNSGDEPAASTTVAGISEYATPAEAEAGTAADRSLTPLSIATLLKLQSRVFGVLETNGTGAPSLESNSLGLASVSRTSLGKYKFTYSGGLGLSADAYSSFLGFGISDGGSVFIAKILTRAAGELTFEVRDAGTGSLSDGGLWVLDIKVND